EPPRCPSHGPFARNPVEKPRAPPSAQTAHIWRYKKCSRSSPAAQDDVTGRSHVRPSQRRARPASSYRQLATISDEPKTAQSPSCRPKRAVRRIQRSKQSISAHQIPYRENEPRPCREAHQQTTRSRCSPPSAELSLPTS